MHKTSQSSLTIPDVVCIRSDRLITPLRFEIRPQVIILRSEWYPYHATETARRGRIPSLNVLRCPRSPSNAFYGPSTPQESVIVISLCITFST